MRPGPNRWNCTVSPTFNHPVMARPGKLGHQLPLPHGRSSNCDGNPAPFLTDVSKRRSLWTKVLNSPKTLCIFRNCSVHCQATPAVPAPPLRSLIIESIGMESFALDARPLSPERSGDSPKRSEASITFACANPRDPHRFVCALCVIAEVCVCLPVKGEERLIHIDTSVKGAA
jgi:hypothetical protein